MALVAKGLPAEIMPDLFRIRHADWNPSLWAKGMKLEPMQKKKIDDDSGRFLGKFHMDIFCAVNPDDEPIVNTTCMSAVGAYGNLPQLPGRIKTKMAGSTIYIPKNRTEIWRFAESRAWKNAKYWFTKCGDGNSITQTLGQLCSVLATAKRFLEITYFPSI